MGVNITYPLSCPLLTKNSANPTPSSPTVTSSISGPNSLSWYPFLPLLLGFFQNPKFLTLSLSNSVFFFFLCGFRLSTKGSVWEQWCVKWGSIGIRSEATLLCWLSSILIEAEALVIVLSANLITGMELIVLFRF